MKDIFGTEIKTGCVIVCSLLRSDKAERIQFIVTEILENFKVLVCEESNGVEHHIKYRPGEIVIIKALPVYKMNYY